MTFMAIDGNSLLHRSYYGVKTPLTTADGQATGALFGFLSALIKLLEDFSPDGVCVVFDLPAPTFRHTLFDGYKKNRRPMPDDLASQIPLCKELLDALRVSRFELAGYEGDDLLGAISRVCRDEGWDCAVVTGDRDCFQLIDARVQVLLATSRAGRTVTLPYTQDTIRAEFGMTPSQLIDLKALMGDASDSIPGVPGVGEKTALALMHQFGSLDALYAQLANSDLRATLKDKLAKNKDLAYLSRTLAVIDRQAPISFHPEEHRRRSYENDALFALLKRLEFRKWIEKLRLTPPALLSDADSLGNGGAQRPAEGGLIGDSGTRADGGVTAGLSDAGDILGAATPPPETDVSSAEGLTALLAVCARADLCGVVLSASQTLRIATGDAMFCVRRIACQAEDFERFLLRFFSPEIKKAAHNVKDLLHEQPLFASAHGFVMDTALGAYLLSPTDGKYPFDALYEQAFGVRPQDDGERAHGLRRLALYQRARLEADGLLSVLDTIELPLCAVLFEMEQTGCRIDKEKLSSFGQTLSRSVVSLEARIHEYAGAFNIQSPKQLAQILFERLGLPPLKKTKSGPSTDVDVLTKLKPYHPIIADIMEYRQLTKLKSTYVDGLLSVAGIDGRVHTRFRMTATATGRLSSTEPNLQNIPIRTELGGALRRMFIAADGCVLVDADYSQIELRVLAHIARDPIMQHAFRTGEDIHTVTASQVFGVAPGDVTPLMRRRAKAVNFGIVYGISAFSLADDLGVTQAEARSYIEQYLEKYSGVRAYMHDIVETARRDGYVSTLFGRRRALPELASSNRTTKALGERLALNTPIQGSAADIMKLAMIAVHRRLQAECPQARLILQVHDELIVECPKEDADAVARILEREMEQVYPLDPPLEAKAHIGANWLEAK